MSIFDTETFNLYLLNPSLVSLPHFLKLLVVFLRFRSDFANTENSVFTDTH